MTRRNAVRFRPGARDMLLMRNPVRTKPRLDNVDEAMRRRLLLVPFTVQLPPEERDPDLPRKLEAEWPAILRWMIDGCLEWQRIGLAPPAIVTDATAAYFDDQDII